MREQIAEIILKQYSISISIIEMTDQILNLISEEIEKVENPFGDYKLHSKEGFEICRQKILNLLRPKENITYAPIGKVIDSTTTIGNAEL